ncbi:MAG: kinase/pyrophosphorylase [Gammaproteobacteria bacterium]|nr:kinase/pyrophosphorylase [Gammaproteobacteria bacterium]
MTEPSQRQLVFLISDRTGITAETLGHGLMSQFEGVDFELETMPFIDSEDKAHRAVAEINHWARENSRPPIVFSTMVRDELRTILSGCEGVFFDFFEAFLEPLEQALGRQSSHTIGRSHGVVDRQRYTTRMDSVNYSLTTDDGINTRQYRNADIILIGVSRSGKTPTCLYLAMHYGIRAANYPLVEEDLQSSRLPEVLEVHRERLYGLTIQPERLQQIREKRRPGSRYSSMDRCRAEVSQVEDLYQRLQVPFVNTSSMSVEEIAAMLMHERHLPRRI